MSLPQVAGLCSGHDGSRSEQDGGGRAGKTGHGGGKSAELVAVRIELKYGGTPRLVTILGVHRRASIRVANAKSKD